MTIHLIFSRFISSHITHHTLNLQIHKLYRTIKRDDAVAQVFTRSLHLV